MTTKKSASKASKTATPPARKKLTLKKDALKDLTAARPGKAEAVKGGTYSLGSRR